MAAYLIGHITVRDPALWSEYTAGVRESLQPFGAEVVFRGRRLALLAGALDGDQAVVVRFPDPTALQQWFRSPAYQSLIPLRDRAATVVLAGYEEPG